MTEQEKQLLLLQDLCSRLPYGVKILHTGWDCDRDTDFDTIETLIGIDNRFIYTIWDKTGDRNKYCLSVSNCKPYLRSMSSMTEEEKGKLYHYYCNEIADNLNIPNLTWEVRCCVYNSFGVDWLNAYHFDYRGLIPMELALEAPEEMYEY